MTNVPGRQLVLLTVVLILALPLSRATVPSAKTPASPHPKGELARAVDAVSQHGLQAELPPHISTLLGITREEKCPVLQGVVRSKDQIQGFDISVKNHNDIVIFVVDAATNDQNLYLTSPSGTLRRMVSVKSGAGSVVRPSKTDIDAFQKEKQFWENRLASQTSPKLSASPVD